MAEVVASDPTGLTFAGRALDVAKIEGELGKLRYLAAGEPAGGESFVVRASLLNMVVYAENEDRAEHASLVIEDLASHHPSRALIVVAHASDEESLINAQLAAHCHITTGREQNVCCEEVTLHVSGRAAGHLHSVIVPLLVPDLPVYVWWTAELPAGPHQFEELLETADHMIVDSARSPDQAAALLGLAHTSARNPNATLGDLEWDRFAEWRDILRRERQVAEMRHHLDSVQSIEVRYAGSAGGPAPGQALYMLAWIAAELGWDPGAAAGRAPGHITIGHGGRDIAVYIEAVQYPAVDSGALVSLKIACGGDSDPTFLTISRTADPNHLTLRTEHHDTGGEDHIRLDPPDAAAILMQELDAPLRNDEFNGILKAVVPLIEALHSN